MKFTLNVFFLVCVTTLASCSGKETAGSGGQPGGGGKGADQPAPVTVIEAVQKAVPVELRTFGTVDPKAYVKVQSQVTGALVGVHFEQGQDVKRGDLLFTIDSRPAKAEWRIAEANLARDKIETENARAEETRQRGLFEKKLVSEELFEKARAKAEALTATLRADEATIENARLKVNYSSIRSPIDGRTGELMVHLGNLVRASDAVLVTVNQVTPIRVAFSLPQRELPAVLAQVNRGPAAEPQGALRVLAFVPGDDGAPEFGTVTLVDNAVDRTTGTIKLWAEFENAGRRLWPGQLVNVALTLRIEEDAIVVPTRAVETGQKGTYVFVVGKDNTVDDRLIEVARTNGEDTVVAKGLAAGERVVTDGQLRLKPGSKITIKPAGGGAVRP